MFGADKTYTVQEVADLLGLSEFTVRRRIKDGSLKAVMDSKKQGYRVSRDSLMEYANAQNSKVGSLWQKGREISGLIETIGSKFMKSLPIIPATVVIGTLAGMGIGKALGKSSGLNLDLAKADVESDTSEIKELNNVVVLDKIIERLNIELEDYDLQIEYQEHKINQSLPDSEQYQAGQELLFQLKSQKFMILKEIKDLEIRKAILEQMQTN